MRIARNYDIAFVWEREHIWIKGELLWCICVWVFFSFSPTCPRTWLLTVAGTTYKLVVIKVFDLLWFPVDAHISGLANTVLLPLWSMNDDEAKATKRQFRDWTWRKQWNGGVGRGDRGILFFFTLQCSYGNTSILGCKHILWIVKKTVIKIIDYIVYSLSAKTKLVSMKKN